MGTLLPLEGMSSNEKLIAMEELWEDISKNSLDYKSPEWHKNELEKRAEKAQCGEDEYLDINEAKNKIHLQLNR